MSGPMSLRQVISDLFEQRLDGMFVGCPGTVVAYNATTQRADVQPDIQRRRYGEDDEPIDEPLPVIPNVPVEFPGTRLFRLIWDIQAGEQVWLKFSHDPLEKWEPGTGGNTPPTEMKRFSLTDAVAQAGIRPGGSPRTVCPKNTMMLGAEDGPTITIDQDALKVTVTALNEIAIVAGARLTLEAPDVFINGRHVDLNPGDI